MINAQELSDRLKIIMDYYQLSASTFAERIGVQPSSISHLLSGRNKPSLEFVLKLLDEFKEVELYWLLNGKGTFPISNIKPTPPQSESPITSLPLDTLHDEAIERIVVFFKNGTFKNYKP